jgi:hypothetical protein
LWSAYAPRISKQVTIVKIGLRLLVTEFALFTRARSCATRGDDDPRAPDARDELCESGAQHEMPAPWLPAER